LDTEPPSYLENLDAGLIYGVLAIFVLLVFSALISGAEVAIFSLSQKDLDDASQQKSSSGKLLKILLEKPKRLLASILITNNFINIAIVIVFAFIKNDLFSGIQETWLLWLVEIGVVTFLILFFGEVLPKIYANRNNVKFALMMAPALNVLNQLLTPLNIPMRSATIYLENKLGRKSSGFSVDQLSQALELADAGETSQEEQKILEGIVSFGSTEASQIMSPRIDVFALCEEEPFKDIIIKILDKGYSRIPIYRENIDTIIGILFVKDLLPYLDRTDFEWNSLIRPPFFVPENKKLDDLLKEFQTIKSHLAIVVDEYGGTSGLVTLEDIIEEIVGDISDEFDDENINYSKIDDHTFIFDGKINLKDFFRITEVAPEAFEEIKGEAETLAGLILEGHGFFPKKGQKLNIANCVFTIEAVDKKRIKQVKVNINA
jgi:putative hemolysin